MSCGELDAYSKDVSGVSYEGSTKNLIESPLTHNTMEGPPPLSPKMQKSSTLTSLQVINGAEKAEGLAVVKDEHCSSISEAPNSPSSAGQSPKDDAACVEMSWEPNFRENPVELANDSSFVSQVTSDDGSVPSTAAFAFGNLETSFIVQHSSLPNQVAISEQSQLNAGMVTDEMVSEETVTSDDYNTLNSQELIDNNSYAIPEIEVKESTETLGRLLEDLESIKTTHTLPYYGTSDCLIASGNEVQEATDNLSSIIKDSLGFLGEGDNFELQILTEDQTGMLMEDLDNMRLDSATSDFDLGHNFQGLDDLHEFEEGQLDDLAPDNQDNDGPAIPTTVGDFSDDECVSTKSVKRSRRLSRKKAESDMDRTVPGPDKVKQQKSIFTFLLDSLSDPSCNPACIRWHDRSKGQFKIVDGPRLATRWSDGRNRGPLKYGHFARAMRHYYKKGDLKRVTGKKLMYEFGASSAWREHRPQPLS